MEKHENTLATSQREQFGSRIAFVLASMGGAIGLGNVWKFPYMVGKYGGAAFIVVYLIALLFIGAPILMTEFAIGRKTGNSYTSALKILRPGTKWHYVGIIGVIALVLTLGFYGGIAGWTVAYLFKSIAGTFTGMSADQVGGVFGTFITDPVQVILWLAVMIGITTFVVMKGVNGGIEKVCNILLPVLFIMIVALAIRSVMLPGSGAGVEFYLKPDFSLITGEVVVFSSILNTGQHPVLLKRSDSGQFTMLLPLRRIISSPTSSTYVQCASSESGVSTPAFCNR